jgi:hypothetical protein
MEKTMANEKQSDPIDQIGMVLSAIKDPKERSELLFDPHGYSARRGVRLDPGFTDAIQIEVNNINRKLYSLEEELGVSITRINDPRAITSAQTLTIRPGEVAILPLIVAVAEVVSAAAIVVIAVTEVYQATKWRTAASLTQA